MVTVILFGGDPYFALAALMFCYFARGAPYPVRPLLSGFRKVHPLFPPLIVHDALPGCLGARNKGHHLRGTLFSFQKTVSRRTQRKEIRGTTS